MSITELIALGRFIHKFKAWRGRGSKKDAALRETELAFHIQEHALCHFRSHCRELANELISRDPDRFLALAKMIATELSAIQELSTSDIMIRIKALYKSAAEFNLLDSMDCHTTYKECFSHLDSLVLEKYFRDIQVWCALNYIMAHHYVSEAWLNLRHRATVPEAAYGFLYYREILPDLEGYLEAYKYRLQVEQEGLEEDEEI